MPDNKREEVIELLPCPFCGQPPKPMDHSYSEGGSSIRCRNMDGCDIQPDVFFPADAVPHDKSRTSFYYDWAESDAKAIAAWNTRAGAASIDRVQVVREAFNSVKIEASLQDCLIRDVDWFKAMDVVLAEIEGDGK